MENQSFSSVVKIVERLTSHGFQAFFAGGWVRDYVMGHPSFDIDIATNAKPQQILDLFSKTQLVGLSFGVVIVTFEGLNFEVSSFRKDFDYKDGRKPEKIAFCSAKEDAKRRDFTINGMFYDPIEKIIYDYVGGIQDIQHGVIRTIGNPSDRFFEDRLRMIRAVRFSARFSFPIEPETQSAIFENSPFLFPSVAKERILQEFDKMVGDGKFDYAIIEMHQLGLLSEIFPDLKKIPLHTLKEYVSSFSKYPKNCPTVLYLLALFPTFSFDQLEPILDSLKVSNKAKKLAQLAKRGEVLACSFSDLVGWCHFLAEPDAELIITVMSAKKSKEDTLFINQVATLKERLWLHIQRIIENKPLVSSKDLMAHGILPGKAMGKLLKEAEIIAIIKDFDTSKEVLNKLLP